VATFRFIVATNSPPQWIDGLTEWFAAGTNQPAKGFMQWSLQDGRTLSPELDKLERWDMKLQPAGGGGASYSLWMNKVWRNAGLTLGDKFRIKPETTEDIWVMYMRLEGRTNFSKMSDMYGSNFVLMQVSLEALPPGLSAGATGFGGNGTNWLDLLPRLFKTKLPKLTNFTSSTSPANHANTQMNLQPPGIIVSSRSVDSQTKPAEEIKSRIKAAAGIVAFPDRDPVLAAIATDAARDGDLEDARDALQKMTAFPARDDAIGEVARQLAAAGKRADAMELAKLVTAFPARDALIGELAK
jgi:hypothetical protein